MYIATVVCVCVCVCVGGGASACVFASTMGSVVLRYSITLPHPDSRLVDINRAFPIGEREGEQDLCLSLAYGVSYGFMLKRNCLDCAEVVGFESPDTPPKCMRVSCCLRFLVICIYIVHVHVYIHSAGFIQGPIRD